MKIKNYGLMSEVIDNNRVLFVGSLMACEDYMNIHQTVGVNEYSESVTRQAMKAFFEMVEDKDNWKSPVSKAVSNDLTQYEKDMISEAVAFFTGSGVVWSYKDGKNWIEFDGYYKAIGA